MSFSVNTARCAKRGWIAIAGFALCLVVSTTVALAAQVSVGHSGWRWLDPIPQGNTLLSTDFSGDRGYAVGAFGTVLRTDDGGANWSGISMNTTRTWNAVRALNAETLVIAGGCALRRSTDGGDTFVRLPWVANDSRCASEIASFDFPVAATGYLLLDNGTVMRSSDSGKSWSKKTAMPGSRTTGGQDIPADIRMFNASTGVAASGSKIFRTTDSGGSWKTVLTADSKLNQIHFVDANVGYAAGFAGAVYMTRDAGVTWARATGPTGETGSPDLTGIRCLDSNVCLATAKGSATLYRTADGATSWTSVTPSSSPLNAVDFATGNRVVALGNAGTTTVSDDGGLTWSAVGSRMGESFSGLRGLSKNSFLAFSPSGAIQRTADGGASWLQIGVPVSTSLIDVAYSSANVGYALDASGGIYRTDNGGEGWSVLDSGTSAVPRRVLALNDSVVLLVGDRGVRRSSNSGELFELVRGAKSETTAMIGADLADRAAFVYGGKALFVSTDRGVTWKAVKLPKKRQLAEVDFISAKVGFITDTADRIWKTTNGGEKWAEILTAGDHAPYGAIAFSDSKNGLVIASTESDNGQVLRTSDGGKSWRPQLVAAAGLRDLLAIDGVDLSLGSGTQTPLFITTTHGDAGKDAAVSLTAKAKKVKKGSNLRLAGKIAGAKGGETAIVSARTSGQTSWQSKTAIVASNGTFTTVWKIRKTTFFVAQSYGGGGLQGDGTELFTVKAR